MAIDGKTGGPLTARRGLGAIHMVSAWAKRNGVCLGQMKTDKKSNEITAIPALLGLLELRGCIVTIDAMGCQREGHGRIAPRTPYNTAKRRVWRSELMQWWA